MTTILVPIKRVIDYAVKIRVAGGKVVTDNVKHSMNPFDEIALEQGIRLVEQKKAKDVIAVTVGPQKSVEVLRSAMAMGAGKAVHLLTEEEGHLRPLQIAKLLKKYTSSSGAKLVILGKQAIDDDSNQTGQMLAGLLGWPQATFANSVELEASSIVVGREIDGGTEKVQSPLPAIVTVDLRLNTPRFITLPNIMKAKKKPVETIKVADMKIDLNPTLIELKVEEPPARVGGGKVKSVDELIEKLKAASVI